MPELQTTAHPGDLPSAPKGLSSNPAIEVNSNPYDWVPYSGYPRIEMHPSRLAAIGMWHGMAPAPTAQSRVLELGCGDGAHLLPLAMAFPESWFVGIDLAESAILEGRKMADALGLKNIELRRLDILERDESLGSFDYIMAHGLYSWVPPAVRDRLLALCRESLSAHGIAYISYNTLPGCYSRLMLRDMLVYHTRGMGSPKQKVDEARSLLTLLRDAQPEGDGYRDELDRALHTSDASIFHDDMGPVNEPVYFHQFMQQASCHGLQYVADADLVEAWDRGLPPDVREQLQKIGDSDILMKAQYLDFLRCARFRRTLLCRAEVPLDRRAKPSVLTRLHATLHAQREADPNEGLHCYRKQDGEAITINHPMVCAALEELVPQWPQPLSCGQLLEAASQRCGIDPEADGAQIWEWFEYLWALGFIQLHAEPPRFAAQAGQRPLASPLARLQAAQGSTRVSNLAHSTVDLQQSLAWHTLLLCDGTRDRDTIANALCSQFRESGVVVMRDGEQAGDGAEAILVTHRELDVALAELAQLRLLVEVPDGETSVSR